MSEHLPVSLEGLPASLVDVADALGLRVALGLMQHFGGQDLSIPKSPRDDHPIVLALGREDAHALGRYLAGAVIYVPNGKANQSARRDVLALQAEGLAREEIARRLGISKRHVRRMANRRDPSPNQLNLFDDQG